MNPHKYFASADLISNPLCGISTYKDILNLATGQITRNIKNLVLTGNETWAKDLSSDYLYYANRSTLISDSISKPPIQCSHLESKSLYSVISNIGINTNNDYNSIYLNFGADIMNAQPSGNTVEGLKEYIAAQYAAGTPVTIWYVLAEPETEQITVPSGLTGTVEGYLIQDGTPTPEAPIYPIANTAKGWYDISSYKHAAGSWATGTEYERSGGAWT